MAFSPSSRKWVLSSSEREISRTSGLEGDSIVAIGRLDAPCYNRAAMRLLWARLDLAAGVESAAASPWNALWTFPAMIASAFLVAWGAEAAEFLVSQGLALAVLALVQTLPEFAVEAVIAWKAGKDHSMVHLAIANFTGSLRLLTGLGWPMIYAVAAFYSRRRHGRKLGEIQLHDEHAAAVLGLLPPPDWFVVVWTQSSLSLSGAAFLTLA